MCSIQRGSAGTASSWEVRCEYLSSRFVLRLIGAPCRLRWNRAKLRSSCWAQGWLISTGDIASSVFNAAIALHTFLFLVLNYKAPQRALYFVVVLLWIMVYALPVVGIMTTENGKRQGGYYVRANSWVSLDISPACRNRRVANRPIINSVGSVKRTGYTGYGSHRAGCFSRCS